MPKSCLEMVFFLADSIQLRLLNLILKYSCFGGLLEMEVRCCEPEVGDSSIPRTVDRKNEWDKNSATKQGGHRNQITYTAWHTKWSLLSSATLEFSSIVDTLTIASVSFLLTQKKRHSDRSPGLRSMGVLLNGMCQPYVNLFLTC